MTKKTFLKKLSEKLNCLDEHEKEKIIRKYEHIIDEEIKSGTPEKDVIASLGSIDMIARLYTKGSEGKKEKSESNLADNNIFNDFFTFIDDTFNKIDDKLAKKILLIICFVMVAVFGLVLIRIPFKIIDIVGTNTFNLMFNDHNLFKVISGLWSVSITLCYLGLVIWLIMHYVRQIANRYDDFDIKPNLNSNKTKEDKPEDKIDNKINDGFNIIYIIVKIFIVILTIPFIFLIMGLIFAFIIFILLMAYDVILFGPAILILGLIILFSTILDLIYTSIFKGGNK